MVKLLSRYKKFIRVKETSPFFQVNLKFVLLEVILITIVMYAGGYILNKKDPLYVNNDFRYVLYLLPLSVITLFYGFVPGLIYNLSLFTITFLNYGYIKESDFMFLILYLLVFAEFHFYWSKKIRLAMEKHEYAMERLRDVGRALFLTKLSHERLEKYHVVKPISIRSFIMDIRKDIMKGMSEEQALRTLFRAVVGMYGIQEAGLFSFKDGDFRLLDKVGDVKYPDNDNIIIGKALLNKETLYLPANFESEKDYLCVMPFHTGDNKGYLLIIQKMPFLHLNSDNIASINLLFFYVIEDYYSLSNIKGIYDVYENADVEFLRELFKLKGIRDKYGVESSLALFYITGLDDILFNRLSSSIRGVDLITRVESERISKVAVILPFTDLKGAAVFTERVLNLVERLRGKDFVEQNIKYEIYDIEKVEPILERIYGAETVKA